MPTLICEGSCNPSIGYVDRLVTQQWSESQVPFLTEYEIAQQRTLIYTPHVMVTPFQARCTECKTMRRYGSL